MKEVFILATGGSLNDITEEEKEYIKTCPTIAVGHYLLYHELIGIVPDHFLMCGCPSDHPTRSIGTHGMFHTISQIMLEMDLKTILYTTPTNCTYLKGEDFPWDSKIPGGIEDWTKNRSLPPKNPNLKTVGIDCSEHGPNGNVGVWAKNIDDKFFFNSSIATSINLACVLYPGYKIKLLGNDGGVSGNYFHSERNIDPLQLTVDGIALSRFVNAQIRSKKNIHYNNTGFHTRYCNEKCLESNNQLFNCNPNSWFTLNEEVNEAIFKNNKPVFEHIANAMGGQTVSNLQDVKRLLPNLFQQRYQPVITNE